MGDLPKYEFGFNIRQWMIGFNTDPAYGTNFFFGPFRFSINAVYGR